MGVEEAKHCAVNAIKWIDGLSKTMTKQQSAYLGSPKFGYNIFGYGCKIFDLAHFPDEKYSKEFSDLVGLIDEKGTFLSSARYGIKEYMSLEAMTRNLSYRRIATFMKRVPHLRVIFKPMVAEILIKHYSKRHK